MPTKRTRITRKMEGDVQEWLTMLFQDPLYGKYLSHEADPWAKFCQLLYGQPLTPTSEEMEELRQLWFKHKNEILRIQAEIAPDLDEPLWAQEEFGDEKSGEG